MSFLFLKKKIEEINKSDECKAINSIEQNIFHVFNDKRKKKRKLRPESFF